MYEKKGVYKIKQLQDVFKTQISSMKYVIFSTKKKKNKKEKKKRTHHPTINKFALNKYTLTKSF